MKIWFLSDLHLFHENMLRGGKIGIRSFNTLYDMHERIIEGWNSVVRPGDKVYEMGDLTLSRPKGGHVNADQWAALISVVNRLQGQKRKLYGNHDHYLPEHYHALGFDKVMAYREMAGILFSHIPVHVSQFYRFRGNVHGHTHEAHVMKVGDAFGGGRPDPRYINVCVEPRNYVPMSLDEIVAHYDRMEKW